MLDETTSTRSPGQGAGERSRHSPRWTPEAVLALLELPFADLLFRAQQVHRAHHDANAVQLSTLLSIKTGGCSEDCGYCPQAARHATGVGNEAMLGLDAVLDAARGAKEAGATRFCMGAAWRGPKDRDLAPVTVREGQRPVLDVLAQVRDRVSPRLPDRHRSHDCSPFARSSSTSA